MYYFFWESSDHFIQPIVIEKVQSNNRRFRSPVQIARITNANANANVDFYFRMWIMQKKMSLFLKWMICFIRK